MVKRAKRPDTDWEKLLSKHISGKSLYLEHIENIYNSIIRQP